MVETSSKEESIFRSAEMSLIQLYIPTEISRQSLYCLGKLGTIQFRDLNAKVNAFQRSFVQEIKRLDNVERQYRFFSNELAIRNIKITEEPYMDSESNDSIGSLVKASEIDEYVENANILEERVSQLIDSSETLLKRQMDCEQALHVLSCSDEFFKLNSTQSSDLIALEDDDDQIALSSLENGGAPIVNFVAGVIARSKILALQKILWRSLRGNLYMNFTEISKPIFDPKSKKFIDKNCFIIFAHGDLLLSRIRKICESMDSDLYFVEPDTVARSKQISEVQNRSADINNVLDTTTRSLNAELSAIADELYAWWNVIKLEKSIYQIQNSCYYDLGRKCLIAEGWVPNSELQSVKSELFKISNNSTDSETVPIIINILETTRTPPTFHRTNKFTVGFQNICDAYGIATYREINAGLPTIVTFPFMFAIMFGDAGHGFIMTLAALTLVLNEKRILAMKRDEIFDMAFVGRYILLLMGIFSMFTGLMYNDIFSVSTTFFKSGWEWPSGFEVGDTVFAKQVGVYAWGFDPVWHGAENALLFSNSYKMKLSILMGYMHMSYSYMFSLANHIYFNSMIDIIGNFIPGLLFMQGIFGYLSICIIYKWSVDWIHIGKSPPGLLNMLISMFLSPGNIEEELYPHQATVQIILLLIALVCVPWLLLLKPMYFKYQLSKKHHYHQLQDNESSAATDANNLLADINNDDDEVHEEHTFGDVMIHQVIHTIEFCLNTVSHTASYLRLWALSLAHAQLSTVLWTMTISNTFGMTGFIGVFATVVMFAFWFCLTVAILVVMEGTSAMLHSLRLHWVESMSKFFEGEGTLFEPFDFKTVLNPGTV
ncbi:hypothetical protein PACTADRAFT_48037 [Pachysolen tannophilus NRRL Y-2460]|uniref:V-type proton ATPase subunit a n=1 Tax=Pachysolen tannophilus NRRL Y-2460 TaxID=669874 RepID=A0A1E4U2L8_PACTA|nr:hypothetical protein PACTADRAFT_48037 [Pachysolen tannophilus NRRL Y-2460]